MKPFTLCLILAGLLFSACKENDPDLEPGETTVVAKDYFYPLAVGNYWAYKVESEQGIYPNFTIQTSVDTTRIIGDSIIDGINYYHVHERSTGFYFVRDSAGYIVYSYGRQFEVGPVPNTIHSQDTTDAGFFYRVYKTGCMDTLITVPAGTFQCVERVGDIYYLRGDPPPPNTNPRPVNYYYGKNIGLVKFVYWYSSGQGKTTKELVDYHFMP